MRPTATFNTPLTFTKFEDRSPNKQHAYHAKTLKHIVLVYDLTNCDDTDYNYEIVLVKDNRNLDVLLRRKADTTEELEKKLGESVKSILTNKITR